MHYELLRYHCFIPWSVDVAERKKKHQNQAINYRLSVFVILLTCVKVDFHSEVDFKFTQYQPACCSSQTKFLNFEVFCTRKGINPFRNTQLFRNFEKLSITGFFKEHL